MPNPIADLNTYKTGVDADVTTKVAINSISPVEVGAIGTDLADLLLPYLQSINNQAYYQGTLTPNVLVGADLDLYYQQLTSGFSIWRKENSVWVLKVTMSQSPVEDGIITGLRTFINGMVVTVDKGTWSISNVRYSKATQTQFTVPTADVNWLRYDLLYANNAGAIGYTTGTASSTPVMPTPAAGQIIVDYVVVPNSASGAQPYLLSGGGSGTGGNKLTLSVVLDGSGEFDFSGAGIPDFPLVTIYDSSANTINYFYNNTTKKITSGIPGETITVTFI